MDRTLTCALSFVVIPEGKSASVFALAFLVVIPAGNLLYPECH